MADEWYYAVNREQKGPVSVADMLALAQAGVITPTALVWRTGLPDWRPWSAVAAELSGSQPSQPGEEVVVCAYSRQPIPRSQAVRYGDQWVAAVHRDAFLQQLEAGRQFEGVNPSGMAYVGFWWRVLGALIDGVVEAIVGIILLLPYYIMFFGALAKGTVSTSAGGNPFVLQGTTPVMLVAQLVGSALGFAFNVFYATWMTGKYGGTLGKLALGFRVVRADGGKVGYLHAFARWAAKLLNMLIWIGPFYVIMLVGAAVAIGMSSGSGASSPGGGILIAMGVSMLWLLIGGIGYYMVGWTKQKTGLHDRMCGTRVVRRDPTVGQP